MNISVVIPVKNRLEQLRLAVSSASSIDLVSEIIVVDDGSDRPVGGEDIRVASYTGRLTVIRIDTSRGAQNARHVGYETAQSKYILFLDSDDLLIAEGVVALFNHAEKYPELSLFYGNLKAGKGRTDFLRVHGSDFIPVLRNMSLCPFSGLLVRRGSVQWSEISTDLPAWQDDDFCLTVAKHGGASFCDTVAAEYIVSVDSISRERMSRIIGLEKMIGKWGGQIQEILGIWYVIVWRLVLSALRVEYRMSLLRQRSRQSATTRILYLAPIKAMNLYSRLVRAVARRYLDRLYV